MSNPLENALTDVGDYLFSGSVMAGGDPLTPKSTVAPSTKGEGKVGSKNYKFKEVPANPSGVEDYTGKALDLGTMIGPIEKGTTRPSVEDQDLSRITGSDITNSTKLTDKEYQALTTEASKGNKLAQDILVRGKYKAQQFPTLTQDTSKLEDPFVRALSGLPAFAQGEQSVANAVVKPYDFTNAEGQVDSLLGQMGSSMRMSASPETQSYLNTLSGITGEGANNLSASNLGLPSIMTALGGLGPAAKTSEKASPYASLLAALLSHQQYETVYGGQSPASTGDPAWLQNLIASVTGTAVDGGLVSPSVAAAGIGTTPSAATSPTGSNA